MAIARGAGTEIIRSILFNNQDSSSKNLIYGERHHIYTVLSVICFAQAVAAPGNFIQMYVEGYAANSGLPGEASYIFRQDMQALQTFVWDTKFSFNGYEPVDITHPMDSAAEQNAIADQLVSGDGNIQKLKIASEGADTFDIVCTFIDQNNS
jgi:hypothetical protein